MSGKGIDKFLLAIVVGVVVLVSAAFAIVLLRPAPAYRADDTPEDIVHNYLFALQQKDYARTYGYLSREVRGRPGTPERFASDISKNPWRFSTMDSATTWVVQDVRVNGTLAIISVQVTRFEGNSIFASSQYKNTVKFTLRQENGAWKIFDADAYWLDCWDRYGGCS